MNVTKYLSEHFPGLHLSPGLFRQWTVGIRFELNGEMAKTSSADDLYFAAVNQRARTIYRDAFQDASYALVVSVENKYIDTSSDALTFSHRRSGKQSPEFFRFSKIEQIGLGGPSGRTTSTNKTDRHETELVSYQWAEVSPLQINYERIFEAIANQDFPQRSPALSGNIYFIDPERHIILHMYDDRGMDVIAKSGSAIQFLYSTRNTWILDYDRQRIDLTFDSSNSA